MAENTTIEWCDHTFNPWQGCTKVSPGCDHCYAEARQDKRLHRVSWGAGQPRQRTKTWGDPGRWNRAHAAFYAANGRRQRVFCASLADWLDNEVPTAWLVDLLELIRRTPDLDWLLLTKRIGNWKPRLQSALAMAALSPGNVLWQGLADWIADWLVGTPPANVWLGATIVNQEEADRDIPKLLVAPARGRFLSMEPLLGPVSLRWLAAWPENPAGRHAEHPSGRTDHLDGLRRIDWVIVGGESGSGARPMHPDWARSLRDQCAAAGVPFLFKQWGEFLPASADEADPAVADVPESRLFWSDGSKWDRFDGQRAGVDPVARVGKKAAGRRLDGRTHDAFPEVEGSPK